MAYWYMIDGIRYTEQYFKYQHFTLKYKLYCDNKKFFTFADSYYEEKFKFESSSRYGAKKKSKTGLKT